MSFVTIVAREASRHIANVFGERPELEPTTETVNCKYIQKSHTHPVTRANVKPRGMPRSRDMLILFPRAWLCCAGSCGSSNDKTVCEDDTEWKSGLDSRVQPVAFIVRTSLDLESTGDVEAAASTCLEVWSSALSQLASNRSSSCVIASPIVAHDC